MSDACTFEGCTVGETGACALENDPATCDRRLGRRPAPGAVETGIATGLFAPDGLSNVGDPVLEKPEGTASFPSSRTLGPNEVSAIMGSRYLTVVGILGDPESGKTACLVSLYLLVSNAQLAGWSFADSKSLMAFEEIARGARDWDEGNPPEQMTVHTEMADERRPGFLHLRLVRNSDGRRVDLALPDLPGEWTTDLVATSRTDRFEFMKSAEAIWVVLDGRALENKERRQGIISRVGQLAGRLSALFEGSVPRLLLVITHRDAGEVSPSVITRLEAELAKRHMTATIVPVAPFSEDDENVRPGFGLERLIAATTENDMPPVDVWPTSEPVEGVRSYIGYRGRR